MGENLSKASRANSRSENLPEAISKQNKKEKRKNKRSLGENTLRHPWQACGLKTSSEATHLSSKKKREKKEKNQKIKKME